jgi:hypothetical protein
MVEVFIPQYYHFLAHCREAAQTDFLARAGLKIAVTALADDDRRLFGLFDPMAVLLKGLGRALGLHVFAGSVLYVSFIWGLFGGHKNTR